MTYTYFKLNHNNNGLSELIFDYPKSSINKLSFDALEELKLVFDEIDKNKDIKVLAFSSAKKDFIVGADVADIKNFSGQLGHCLKILWGTGQNLVVLSYQALLSFITGQAC